MTEPGFTTLRQRLRQLLAPGFIGNYDHLELVEVIAFRPESSIPINILSIAVLSEGRPGVGQSEKTEFLIGRRKIDGFRGWSFGLARTLRPVGELDAALDRYERTAQWTLSGQPLATGALEVEPAMFLPPDATATVPINKVLRNNFWAGSHLFRLMDRDKKGFEPFFADRRRLQALSDAVGTALPIAFAGLSDLLGDVLIQLPVTLLLPEIGTDPISGGTRAQAHWRADATPRPLMLSAASRWDEVLTGASIAGPFPHSTKIAIPGSRDRVVTHVIDAQSGVVMGATASSTTIRTMRFNIQEELPEPRTFAIPAVEGPARGERITLSRLHRQVMGDQGPDANHWLLRRQDLEEKRKLSESRDFVQYRRVPNSDVERQRALADIRFLIETHGAGGVDLWDPYLSARDILQTLFWCPHSDVTLRAMTAGKDPPSERKNVGTEVDEEAGAETADRVGDAADGPNAEVIGARQDGSEAKNRPQVVSFVDRERAVLDAYAGNREGLRLEYRTRRGQKGWEFHDRFLIFPNHGDGPIAWSLGTSINSVGGSHHILQRVANPALILGAFEDLWSELNEDRHLVWKSR